MNNDEYAKIPESVRGIAETIGSGSMVGLKIKTVLGIEFEVKGAVVMKIVGGKRVYFCDGAAYPEDFVDEVITTRGNGLKA